MKPIRESVQVAEELSRHLPDFDVTRHLQATADKIQAVVPECVGLSLAWLDQGVAFTLVASDQQIAVLDAVQYLAGGPCIDPIVVDAGEGLGVEHEDLLDERTWQYFSQATAAKGIRSTLTMPLMQDGTVVGSANLYAASDHAFDGMEEEIADILGGSAPDIVHNADLSFSTRRTAERSLEVVRSQGVIDVAVGMVAASLDLDMDTAQERLADAARRAGIGLDKLAQAIVDLRGA